MDPKTVRKLEKRLHRAIVDVICDMGLKHLPLLPSQHTMEMMAKAATAVYEAAEENYRHGSGRVSQESSGQERLTRAVGRRHDHSPGHRQEEQ